MNITENNCNGIEYYNVEIQSHYRNTFTKTNGIAMYPKVFFIIHLGKLGHTGLKFRNLNNQG